MEGKIEIPFWICVSIVSSTSLILLLKQVSRAVNCNHTILLSTCHFVATWSFLEILARNDKIKKTNSVPFSKRVNLAFLVVGSIVLMNFNLGANSIGFYQMSKLISIPYMVFHKMVFKHQKFSALELISLAVLIIGVGLFSVSDVEVNFIGTLFAIAAFLCTVFNQMLTEDYQRIYKVSGQELQLAVVPVQFVFGVICTIAIEAFGEKGFIHYQFTLKQAALMLSTCIFAIGVNLSTFSLIGKTSSVTYQVIGHFKTVLLLVFGYIFFPSKWESTYQMIKAMSGIVIALIGVFTYSKARLDAAKKPNPEEITPLLKEDPATK